MCVEGYVVVVFVFGLWYVVFWLFWFDYGVVWYVYVINGMGVMFGDLVIGMMVFVVLWDVYLGLCFMLYWLVCVLCYVDVLYVFVVDVVVLLCVLLYFVEVLVMELYCIDVGNYLYWFVFVWLLMIDFFFDVFGVDLVVVLVVVKCNCWFVWLLLFVLLVEW